MGAGHKDRGNLDCRAAKIQKIRERLGIKKQSIKKSIEVKDSHENMKVYLDDSNDYQNDFKARLKAAMKKTSQNKEQHLRAKKFKPQ